MQAFATDPAKGAEDEDLVFPGNLFWWAVIEDFIDDLHGDPLPVLHMEEAHSRAGPYRRNDSGCAASHCATNGMLALAFCLSVLPS